MSTIATSTTAAVPTELISYRVNHAKVAPKAAVVGGIALVLGLAVSLPVGAFADFLHSYLAAYLFWFGLTIGCVALTMLHHLTGGRWGDIIRPYTETGMKSLPLMFILFLPILFGMNYIYPWTQPNDDHLTAPMRFQHQVWQNPLFFTIRFVAYFLVWGFFAYNLLKRYKLRDEMAIQDPAHNTGPGYMFYSGPGLLILVATLSLAVFDWGMSVQPGWYSTLYGLLYLVGSGLTTFAFMVILTYLITRQHDLSHNDHDGGHHQPLLVAQDWHDFGNLLFATTMLWGYMSLSQLLITYAGNLPSETIFYQFRSVNGWEYVGGTLIVVHFVVPFILLLQRDLKRNPKVLIPIAAYVLIERQLDFYYQIHPAYKNGLRDKDGVIFSQVAGALGWHTPLHVLAVIGIGGLWLAFFAWNLKDRRVLPAPAQEDHHG